MAEVIDEKRYSWHTDFTGKLINGKPAEAPDVRKKTIFENIDKKCPEARDLLEHLSKSGTGLSKIEALSIVAMKCRDNPELFVERATKMVPEGTIDKINKFFHEKRIAEASAKVKKDEAANPSKNTK